MFLIMFLVSSCVQLTQLHEYEYEYEYEYKQWKLINEKRREEGWLDAINYYNKEKHNKEEGK